MNKTILTSTIQKVAEAINSNEKFVIAGLSVRVTKFAEQYPNDVALVSASNILKKLDSSDKLFITRAELKNLYHTVYTKNTKLADVLEAELDLQELPGPVVYKRAGEDKLDGASLADPVLSNALESLLSGNNEVKMYSKASAVRAEKVCMDALSLEGVTPNKVEVFAGQSDLMIVQASYLTPKGTSNVLVPVEIKDEKVLIPSLFVSQAGLDELCQEKIEGHIKATAGKSFKVDGEKLLKVLATVKNGEVDPVDEVELALIRMRSADHTPAYTSNGIVYQEIDSPLLDIVAPEMEKSAEHVALSERMTTPRGEAEYRFGARIVNAGAEMLVRRLNSFGYKQANVSVAKSDEKSITFACSINRTAAFTVPLKVDGDLVLPPTVAMLSGDIEDFSHVGISNLMQSGSVDKKAIAYASPAYGLKPSELMEQIDQGIESNDRLKIEDAIDVLGSVDANMQKEGMRKYIEFMNSSAAGISKAASVAKSGCSKIVKSANSTKPICGHLHVSVDKVYQDEHGDCQMLYRKHISAEQNPGGTFLVHNAFIKS